MIDAQAWRERLSHVYWIGGPPDAGKSTVVELLESRFDVVTYRQDGHEKEHFRRATAERYPRNAATWKRFTDVGEEAFFQRWVDHDPSTLALEARAAWVERAGLIYEDLAEIGNDRAIIVEGPGLFPEAVAPLLSHPNQAIWLIPTEAFKRASHTARKKSAWRFGTSDPEMAMANHIERDLIFTADYRAEAIEANLPWLSIDGSLDAEAIAHRVAAHFGLE